MGFSFSFGLKDEKAHMAEGFALALDIFEDLETRRNAILKLDYYFFFKFIQIHHEQERLFKERRDKARRIDT